jgi:hypothetical protein
MNEKKLNELMGLLNMASTRGITKDHMRLLVIQAQEIVRQLKKEKSNEVSK